MGKQFKRLLLFSFVTFHLTACVATQTSPPPVQPVPDVLSKVTDCHCSRKLDNKYSIKNKSGLFKENPSWKPIKVYDDGASVYIKLPLAVQVKPTLFILDDKKNPWQLNYQVNKHYLRVDYLFKKALLVNEQEKIEITKN